MKCPVETLKRLSRIMVVNAMILNSMPLIADRYHVEISNFKFMPQTLSVQPGDTVVFTNRDIVPHTATADDKSWDTGEIASGESKTVTVQQTMTENYYCDYHVTMKGRLRSH